MPAHLPRRAFATPFIVTIAACGGSSDAIHANPPAPDTAAPAASATTAPPAETASAPAPQASASVTPPPSGDRTYTIEQSGTKCSVVANVQCPTGATCNPPPPQDYACPAAVSRYPATLTRHAGECTVLVMPEIGHCPPHAFCNPPPPHDAKVPCPK